MTIKHMFKLTGDHPISRYVTKYVNYKDIFATVAELQQYGYIIKIYNDRNQLIY